MNFLLPDECAEVKISNHGSKDRSRLFCFFVFQYSEVNNYSFLLTLVQDAIHGERVEQF